MGKGGAWDQALEEDAAELAEQDHQYWVRMLSQPCCFKPWKHGGKLYTCIGDASAVGYGGYAPELLLGPMVESFTPVEQLLMAQGKLSSCHREVKNACMLAKTCMLKNAEKLRGGRLVIHCDNTGAVANINSLNGLPATLELIREMWEVAAELQVEVTAKWIPRDTPSMQLADHYSKCEDTADYALNKSVYVNICKRSLRGETNWGFCTGDCFAGSVAEFHQTPRFFTKYPSAVGQGADALLQPWSMLDPEEGTPLLWVFPPRELVRQVIDKVDAERKNCIFVVANMEPHWDDWFQHLPVLDRLVIYPRPGMCTVGSRLPDRLRTRDAEGNIEEWTVHLTCYLIRYQDPVRPKKNAGVTKRGCKRK
jgi:hypothetical protein